METIVGGVVVAIAFVFLCLGYFSTLTTPRGGVVPYKAMFDSIDGIALNSDVKIGGVKVGSVSSIDFDGDYRVVVTLGIQKSIKVPDDSSVAVSSAGFMGDKYIEVQPGGVRLFFRQGRCLFIPGPPLVLSYFLTNLSWLFLRNR